NPVESNPDSPRNDVESQTKSRPHNHDPGCCCSWTLLCDRLGHRQNPLIQTLRSMKELITRTMHLLAKLKMDLVVDKRTWEEHTQKILGDVSKLIELFDRITNDCNVNPIENAMFRECSKQLSELERVIQQLLKEDKALYWAQQESPTASVKSEAHRRLEDSVKDHIHKNTETLEMMLKFVDSKTQKRWWLRDCINFAQLMMKIALFISASLAVLFPTEQVGSDGKQVGLFPIITLALSIGQGVIEIMDEYFLRQRTPGDNKIVFDTSIATSITASGKRLGDSVMSNQQVSLLNSHAL
ncbi:hypothetical protein PENTCL1PPCAC_3160, partial [Pristionchus entomophagus]